MGEVDKKFLVQFLSSIYVHGVYELVLLKSTIARVLWGVLLSIALAFLCIQLYRTVDEYQQSPTSLTHGISSTNKFFRFYIFTPSFMSPDKVRQLGFTKNHTLYISMCIADWSLSEEDNAEYMSQDWAEVLKEIKNIQESHKIGSFYELLNAISFDLEELFEWGIDGSDGGLGRESLVDMRPEKIIDDWGVYYSFQLEKVMENASRIADFPMKIITIPRNFSVNLGTHIHRQNLGGDYTIAIGKQYPPRMFEWWSIKSEYEYYVSVKARLTHYLNTKRHPCREGVEPAWNCLFTCYERKSGCWNNCEWFVGQTQDPEKPICHYMNVTDFAHRSGDDFCEEVEAKCQEMCLDPCEVWEYDVDVKKFGPISTLTVLRVFMQQGWSVYVTEERYTYTWNNLLSDVGGILGLCIGASMLSIVHVVFLCCCKVLSKDLSMDRVQKFEQPKS